MKNTKLNELKQERFSKEEIQFMEDMLDSLRKIGKKLNNGLLISKNNTE